MLSCLFSLIVNQTHVHCGKAGKVKENNKVIKLPPIPRSPVFPPLVHTGVAGEASLGNMGFAAWQPLVPIPTLGWGTVISLQADSEDEIWVGRGVSGQRNRK